MKVSQRKDVRGGGEGTYGAGVARERVDLLQLREDDEGLAGGVEAGAERGVAVERGGHRAAEAARDEQLCGGLDGVFRRVV